MALSLPLRLQIEPIVKESFKNYNLFVLPSKYEEKLCIIVSNTAQGGIFALASDIMYNYDEIIGILELKSSEISPFIYVLAEKAWYVYDKNKAFAMVRIASINELKEKMATSAYMYDTNVASCNKIIEGINRYYSRQVLEPAIRGFLSILEKQFPRNDLYLFELLQNAVDDGAMYVIFKSISRNNISNNKDAEGLFFLHNGRPFNSLDCLGLSSVGLSSKTGEKRTIGFMGIGFKSVYKRFSRVVIYDEKWKFMFEDPKHATSSRGGGYITHSNSSNSNITNAIEPTHAYVLKPMYVDNFSKLWGTESDKEWCHFQLELPVGGISSVHNDLKYLPLSIPPLLGRQAIYNKLYTSGAASISSPLEWTLEWENVKYAVSRVDNSFCNISFTSGLMRDNQHGANSNNHWDLSYDSFKINVQSKTQQRGAESKFFLFLSVKYIPNFKAQETFASHTKKPWVGTGGTNKEETSFFFELNPSDLTSPKEIVSNHPRGNKEERFGHVHAVLPTKLKLPTAINWQASWLLSVDRQEVQDIVSNDWNNNILGQAARLFVGLLIWTSKSQFTAASGHKLALIYNLFPPLILEQNRLMCWMLNQKVDMDLLSTVVKQEPVVPIHSGNSTQDIVFKPANMTIWLPPTIVNGIPHSILMKWFNTCPMATNLLSSEMIFSKLWESVPRPTKDLLAKSANRFSLTSTEDSKNTAVLIIQILAAFGSTTALKVPSVNPNPTMDVPSTGPTGSVANNTSSGDGVSSDILCDSMIAPLSSWPILYTDAGEACYIHDIALCSEDFALLPKNIRNILRKGVNLACDSQHKSSSKRSKLLHSEVEDILFGEIGSTVPSGVTPNIITSAKLCLNIFRENFPSRIVTVEQAAHHLFKNIASSGKNNIVVDESQLSLIVELFKYSLTNNRPSIMTHLLVDINQQRQLIPSYEAYISSESLLNIRGATDNKILFVSTLLVSAEIAGPRNRINSNSIMEFLRKCGANTTISIAAVSRDPSKDDISKLEGAVLPKLRTSNTSCNVFLPYGLGLINRKKHYVLDFQFALEWKHIIRSIGKDVAKATSMVFLVSDLLKALEYETVVTADTMPAAAECIKAKIVDESTSIHSNNRLNISGNIPGYKRLLYLPPGQPGASLSNIDIAEWMWTLANSNWIPCYPPGHIPATNDAPTLVLKPCEAMLSSASTVTNTSMPTAAIPANLLKYYQNAPKIVQDTFKWGTVKPAPPIDRLSEIVSDVRDIDPDAFYSELVYIWKEIGLALQENRLSAIDTKKIKTSLMNTKKGIIPYNFKLYPMQRAVSLDLNQYAIDENCEIQATLMLHKIGFIVNIHESNAVYDNEQREPWELSGIISALVSLFQPPKTINAAVAEEYLNYWNGNIPDNAGQPDNCIKKAYSYTLWMYLKPFMGRGYNGSVLPENVALQCATALEKRFPMLQIYCRKGPNFGHNVFPARYLSLFPLHVTDINNTRVRPVLIDDGGDRMTTSGSGITRSSLLKVEHKLQPIMMLSSSVTDKSNSTLVDIDNKLLQILQIPRTSDTKAFILKVATTGSPVRLTESNQLLEIVILLCQLLIEGSNNADGATVRLNNTPPTPNIVKHGSINIHFKAPTMTETAMKPSYCVWGAPEKNKTSEDSGASKSKVIYISGTADDYGTELEELVYSYVVDSMSKTNFINRGSINRPFRALRLLNYIEDNQNFLKRLKRDFDSFFVATNDVNEDNNGIDDSLRLIELIGNLNKSMTKVEISNSKKRGYDDVVSDATMNEPDFEPSLVKHRMSNLPAWMTSKDTTAVDESSSADATTTPMADDGKTNQPSSLVQHRMSNLPAWMNETVAVDNSRSDTLSHAADDTHNTQTSSLVQHRVNDTETVAVDNCRSDTLSHAADNTHNTQISSVVQHRVSNLPMWMTSDNVGSVSPVDVPTESNQRIAQDFLSSLSVDVMNTLESQENDANKKRKFIEDGEVPAEENIIANKKISMNIERVQLELNELICGHFNNSRVSDKLSRLLNILLSNSSVITSDSSNNRELKEIIKVLLKEDKYSHKYNNLLSFCQ